MPSAAPLQVTRIKQRACVHLKSWTTELDVRPLTLDGNGEDIRILIYAPGEWLAVSDVLAGPMLKDHLDRELSAQPLAAVDLSQALAPLRIEGVAARDVLAKSCGLNLDPRVFLPGTCTRTRLAQLPVVVHCTDPGPKYDLYAGRSYLSYLFAWLSDAAMEFE
jgi:sarcosine oxidase, subunit gamma